MFKILMAAAAAFSIAYPDLGHGQSAGETRLVESAYKHILENAYPSIDGARCGPHLKHALRSVLSARDPEQESSRQNEILHRLLCFDRYSRFEAHLPVARQPPARAGLTAPAMPKKDRTVVAVDIGEVRYLRVSRFTEQTGNEFQDEAFFAKGIPPKLILDLRDNPGGDLTVALAVAKSFSPGPGEVTIESLYRGGLSILERTEATGPLKNVPAVILVNEYCGSSCEVVAGLLRYWDPRRKLIGSRTYGKGLIQWFSPIARKKRISLVLTTGEYVIGGDRLRGRVHGKGLVPDILLRGSYPQPVDVDPGVRLALEALHR